MLKYKKENQISAIIFDVDGVLVDTVPFHFRAWQRMFAEVGIPFGKDEYKMINGIPRDTGVELILQASATPKRIQELGDRKQHYYLESISQHPPQPLSGIRSILSEIRRAGWRMAAASSSKNAAVVLSAARIAAYFDAIITGYDFQHPKPHPDIFLTAAHRLGIKPCEAVVVEDAAHGVRAAIAGGFYSVGIVGSESADDLCVAGASVIIDTTDDLTMDLFRGLGSTHA